MLVFRDPGLKRILRYRMFNWGIGSLDSIRAKSAKLLKKQQEAKQLLLAKKDAIKDKATE